MRLRLAAVQHGDYVEAKKIIDSGIAEPYFGMGYTLDVLDQLFKGSEHLVLSINTEQEYAVREKNALLLGFRRYKLPRPIPISVSLYINAKKMCRELKRFKPTHVLLRTGGIYAWQILKFCIKNDISVLVVFANTFDDKGLQNQFLNKQLVPLLNHPLVYKVTNHKQPATDSMVDVGVKKEKTLAWDWPGAKHPKEYENKRLKQDRKKILYVGAVTEDKGVSDLLTAIKTLLSKGHEISLDVVGDGLNLSQFKSELSEEESRYISFLGRVGNEAVFDLMLQCDLMCVPSRHVFTEGMPLTLTEGLASRTPMVVSDHPVFKRAFVENEGVKFFPEKDALALSEAITFVIENPQHYQMMSEGTEAAYHRVECSTTFGDVVFDWQSHFAKS
jgi:glycosyltransferase involved in cell wall biosynthesis